MEAAIFFRVLKHGRKIHKAERDLMLMDLCDIATISLNHENYKTFKKHFQSRSFPAPKKKPMPADDFRTAQIVGAALKAVSPFIKRGPRG